jgi:hypothetical protein
MVKIPASWAGAGFHGLAGSQPIRSPQQRLMRRTSITAYTELVTTDIGNDGVAPTVTVSAGGTAYAVVGPADGLGGTWALDQCYLSTSVGQLDASQVIVYVGPYMGPGSAVQQYAVTGSLAGGSSQFGLGGLGVPKGWFVQAYWTGGTAGSLAQLRVTGAKTVQATPDQT